MNLRFVILHHTGIAEPHFDLMFETYPGSDLATWRAPTWPVIDPNRLTRIKDHRRAYLEFEGELSERRGQVERVASGTCAIEICEGGRWRIRFITGVPTITLDLAASPPPTTSS